MGLLSTLLPTLSLLVYTLEYFYKWLSGVFSPAAAQKRLMLSWQSDVAEWNAKPHLADCLNLPEVPD